MSRVSGAPVSERILLVGADGMLGKAWEQVLVRHKIPHDAVSRTRPTSHYLDVSDPRAVERRLERGYGRVINCTAYTAVDAAEADELAAVQINCNAVRHLAASAERSGSRVVHYSTDYVFSGRATRPYREDELLDPVNAYGRSKALGEEQLRAQNPAHLLIRTSWVYAPWGKNFVLTMRQLMASQPRLSVVNDQRGRPTSVFTLVESSLRLMTSEASGTFHVADGGDCTWFEFALEIARLMQVSCEVRPCTTEQFPRPAPRPAYSVLDTGKAETIIGPLPTWQQSLRTSLEWPAPRED